MNAATESTSTWHPLLHGEPPPWASGWGEDGWGPFVELTVKKVTQPLRWIPPGSFQMGSLKTEPGHSGDEGPQHEVLITQGFWIFDTPCTQALWQAVMGGKNPSYFEDPQRPVEQVSWNDVQAFVLELGNRVVAGEWRLPTEAEWEYACRAGSETAYCFGDSEELLGEYAWYDANSKGSSQIVGTKTPNNWGLHDMHGNVWEWCAAVYDAYHYRRAASKTAIDPVGPASGGGSLRVLRGGSWDLNAVNCRSADRSRDSPGYRNYYLGFRLALSSVK